MLKTPEKIRNLNPSYRDYPSLIRGGHTFSIIRASSEKISSHKNQIDLILALNQDTIDFHKNRFKKDSIVIYDSDSVKLESLPFPVKATIGIPAEKIIKDEKASCIIWPILLRTFL
ncbi:MAG: 2-oxoacid:acceptor oxidoreductase family protein [Candidatus Scalindua sp.]|nr:2-oxoacid:acceptor oxidoreductase family protein [Candidatus Scalindua sp.]